MCIGTFAAMTSDLGELTYWLLGRLPSLARQSVPDRSRNKPQPLPEALDASR
jgi:hypothetical protein